MKKQSVGLPMLALSAALPTGLAAQEQLQAKSPNIIIIYCDDMGYGDLGSTGHPGIATPNIDRMGMDGLRFTNYYSASPASTASRYSLLTGRYPVRAGFRWVLNPDSERGIHPKELTLAEAMKAQGYHTAMYGKWHLGNTKQDFLPLQNGFDEYVGLPYSNDMIPPKYQDIALMNGNDTITLNPDQSILTELYTQKSIEFIRKHKDEKFFVYLPYAMPHVPLYPGKKFIGTSKRGAYGDAVQEIDWAVGAILSALQEEGIAENTIVWFTSDNGPWVLKNEEGGSAGLFRDGKGSTWEGGVRLPCYVSWPGTIQSVINDRLVNAMDIYATCICLAGGELPTDRVIDGMDVSPYLYNDMTTDLRHNAPFFYYGIDHQLMAVRKGPWKLHVRTYSQLGVDYFGKVPLLFNLEVDPSEKYDVSDCYPEIVKELASLIELQSVAAKQVGSFYSE